MSVNKRSVGVAILLSIVTCGLYSIYWLYCLVNDVNTICDTPNDRSGGMVILFTLITCGIYGLFWYYRTGEKLDNLAVRNGRAPGSKGILFLILGIFGLGIINYAIIQSDINTYVDDQNRTVNI